MKSRSISHNIPNKDDWSDYFNNQVSKSPVVDYQPIAHGVVAGPKAKPVDKPLEGITPKVSVPVIDEVETVETEQTEKQPEVYAAPAPIVATQAMPRRHAAQPHPVHDCHHPTGPAHGFKSVCVLQHKPVGMVTPINPNGTIVDDDKPDWHPFEGATRKPRLFIEVIDPNNPHGPLHVRPLHPVINPSDEIEEVEDLDYYEVPDPEVPDTEVEEPANDEEEVEQVL